MSENWVDKGVCESIGRYETESVDLWEYALLAVEDSSDCQPRLYKDFCTGACGLELTS